MRLTVAVSDTNDERESERLTFTNNQLFDYPNSRLLDMNQSNVFMSLK
jgi:hypothetical protein